MNTIAQTLKLISCNANFVISFNNNNKLPDNDNFFTGKCYNKINNIKKIKMIRK